MNICWTRAVLSSEKPSCFEIDFMLDGVRYHYGLETTDTAFVSEWLYEIPKAHHRRLHERDSQAFDFGRRLKDQNRNIANFTRSNSPFLSAPAQTGHGLLSRIYKYFQDIVFSGPISAAGFEVSSWAREGGLDDRVIAFLKPINTGVTGRHLGESS